VNVTGRTLVFGLVGHPVRHSLSPSMHNALFREMGIDALYAAFDVHPDRADRVAEALRTLDLRGVNLTVPFKQAVLPHLDRVTRAVEEAGAANVVIQHEGFLTGYNTDGEGFVRGVEEEFGPILRGARALVLGAGGAARAIAAGLADRGAAEVVFLNRTVSNAQSAASHLTGYFPRTAFRAAPFDPDGFLALSPAADLVVDATSGPAAPQVAALDLSRLPAHAVWCDINYWAKDPPGLSHARARGLRAQDGLPMLVHQGALSFELFTGVPVEPAHIRIHLG
jgi:shikimate dehydrogenase